MGCVCVVCVGEGALSLLSPDPETRRTCRAGEVLRGPAEHGHRLETIPSALPEESEAEPAGARPSGSDATDRREPYARAGPGGEETRDAQGAGRRAVARREEQEGEKSDGGVRGEGKGGGKRRIGLCFCFKR